MQSRLTGAISLVIAQAVVLVLGYLTHLWIGRVLGPVPYGIYGVVLSLQGIFGLILTLGVPVAIARYIAQNDRSAQSILRQGLRIQLAIAVALGITVIALAPFLARLLDDTTLVPYILFMSDVIVSQALYPLYVQFLSGLHLFNRQALLTVFYAVTKVIGALSLIYVFGVFLFFTGIKMLFHGEEKLDPEKNPVLRLVRRLLPITPHYRGQSFFVRDLGNLWATPLILVLVVVETTDLIFALDSIPAIFSITRDPFIVYTSNVFAILGLRALYFLLAGIMQSFRYLKIGLSLVLCFVGAKMVIVELYKIPIGISLATVGGILLLSIVASMLAQWSEKEVLGPRLSLGFLRRARLFGFGVLLRPDAAKWWLLLAAAGVALLLILT
jgi:predicted tellurium resistance membrane protein TerC